ncbi:MAG TPA: zf-HC2 domain-containing protein [Pantanalinema sp.]
MRTEDPVMDCDHAKLQLSSYIDDCVSPDEAHWLHAHLSGCPACTRHLAELLATLQALRALPRLLPGTDCWEAVAFTLRREGLIRAWWARPLPWGVATAGAVAVVVAYTALRPAPPPASLDAYWREHAIFTAQEEPAPFSGGPSIDAIEATFQLQGE